MEQSEYMETIQVVIDKKLLVATDRAARRMRANRSALVREALRSHLRQLEIRAKEDIDRDGYGKQPQASSEARVWEKEASWPEE